MSGRHRLASGLAARLLVPLVPLALLALLVPELGVAQQGTAPDFTAPPGSDRAVASPVYSAPLPLDSAQVAQDAVDLYRRTCLAAVGDAMALVDAALAAGLAPYRGGPEGDARPASLLGEVPGQVFASSGASDLLLAIGDDGRCTVWAQRADGPRMKEAFVAALEAARERGSNVRAVRDRTVRSAGGWRQQLGYEVSAGARRYSADAVTLVAAQPGMQLLRAAPSTTGAPAHPPDVPAHPPEPARDAPPSARP